MALLDVVLFPDEILRTPAVPVENITKETHALINDMVETMYDAPGVGLAAPQVGISQRIIVADVGEENTSLLKLINPEIIERGPKVTSEEGCLSIPGVKETVKRHESVTVKAITPDGKESIIEAEGFLAFCLQHEIDHLDGILFIDYLSKLKKQLIKGKLNRLRKA
ncbi:UNVERIFIED_CONTAM: hypothetical protein GTU68_012988 [Idotea baltica]|nr:hypothetical protein [Idotea baltica]